MRNFSFSDLNGWQRLFVFLCLLSSAFAFAFVNAVVDHKTEVNIYEYLPELSEYPCVKTSPYDCDPVIIALDPKYRKQFVFKDGTTHWMDNRYTDQQVEEAQIKASQKAESNRVSSLISAYKSAAFILLSSWVAIYFIGFMIGWIRKGFTVMK